jgi:uncharacterized protein
VKGLSLVLAALVGLAFGAGLLLAGMTVPAKVIGFLDVTGRWDPSLAFTMGGAVLVYAVAFRWIRHHRTRPWFDVGFHLPSRRDVDGSLVAGAAIFGVGWGLGGLCPGPGLVGAAAGSTSAATFVAAMIAGKLFQRFLRGEVRRVSEPVHGG